MTITLRITDTPSRSKGWGRAKLTGPRGAVISSNTGNEWVGGACPYHGEAVEGDVLELTLEVRTRREERSQETHLLRVVPGAGTRAGCRPGSQGIRVEVVGAELVAETPQEEAEAIASGWDSYDQFADTLRLGVAPEDARRLSPAGRGALLAICRERVEVEAAL